MIIEFPFENAFARLNGRREKNAAMYNVSKDRLHALICLCSRHARARNATLV